MKTESEIMEKIRENLIKILADRGLSKRSLAKASCLDPAIISYIINDGKCITIPNIEKIAKALNMSFINLIEYPNVMVKSEQERVWLNIETTPANKEKILKFINQTI